MKHVILDTGAIYALATAADTGHAEATRFVEQAVRAGPRLLITNTVFSETLTLIKSRRGASAAIGMGRRLRAATLFVWTPLTTEDEESAWEIFQKYADKEWSFVDCGLYALARRLNVPVFTFDHHFAQMPEIARLP
jgi:hypothetical protein